MGRTVQWLLFSICCRREQLSVLFHFITGSLCTTCFHFAAHWHWLQSTYSYDSLSEFHFPVFLSVAFLLWHKAFKQNLQWVGSKVSRCCLRCIAEAAALNGDRSNAAWNQLLTKVFRVVNAASWLSFPDWDADWKLCGWLKCPSVFRAGSVSAGLSQCCVLVVRLQRALLHWEEEKRN